MIPSSIPEYLICLKIIDIRTVIVIKKLDLTVSLNLNASLIVAINGNLIKNLSSAPNSNLFTQQL